MPERLRLVISIVPYIFRNLFIVPSEFWDYAMKYLPSCMAVNAEQLQLRKFIVLQEDTEKFIDGIFEQKENLKENWN